MKKRTLIGIVCSLILATSCKTRLTDFTIISTKNIDLSRASSFKRTNNRIEGEHKVHIIVFIPTGTPNLKTAIDKAIESTKGAVALTDGVVYSKQFYAVLYGYMSYVVEGNALIDPALASVTDDKKEDSFVSLKLNKKGEVVNKSEISKEEFAAAKEKISKGAKKVNITEEAK
ncbi:MAG: hypothetical protein NTZ59_02885 [Bacteroidetes bacterium]|nr:hypothetical protein [Bacteroidota bacterium]